MVTLVFIKRALHIDMTNPGNLILLESAGLPGENTTELRGHFLFGLLLPRLLFPGRLSA